MRDFPAAITLVGTTVYADGHAVAELVDGAPAYIAQAFREAVISEPTGVRYRGSCDTLRGGKYK